MMACCRALAALALVGLVGCYTQFDAAPPPPPQAANKGSVQPKPAPPSDQAAQQTKQDQDKAKNKNKDKDQEPKQSYGEAWSLFCRAEQLSGTSSAASEKERGERVSTWFLQHVKNKQLRYWYLALDQSKPAQCREAFITEARKAGQPQCAVVDLLYPLSRIKPAGE